MLDKEKLKQKMAALMKEFEGSRETDYSEMGKIAYEITHIMLANTKSTNEERVPMEVFDCFDTTMFNSIVLAWIVSVKQFVDTKQGIISHRNKTQAQMTSEIQVKLKELGDSLSDENATHQQQEAIRRELFDMLETPLGKCLPADILSVIDVENRSTILMGWLLQLGEAISPEKTVKIAEIDITDLVKKVIKMKTETPSDRGESGSHAE